MANTYTQLYIQLVFAVKYRRSLINETWESRFHQYTCGIIKRLGHKPIIVNGMPDHQHLFIGLNPDKSISDTVDVIKANTSKWINDNNLTAAKFNWQRGYGAFSYSRTDIDNVYKYILNQKEHHLTQSFLDEYLFELNSQGIDYDERYIFKPLE
jgi:putative transposase